MSLYGVIGYHVTLSEGPQVVENLNKFTQQDEC